MRLLTLVGLVTSVPDPKHTVSLLRSAGIITAADLLFSATPHAIWSLLATQERATLSIAQLEALRDEVISIIAVPSQDGNEQLLLESLSVSPAFVGVHALDEALCTGLLPGEIVEITGPTGCGKTVRIFPDFLGSTKCCLAASCVANRFTSPV